MYIHMYIYIYTHLNLDLNIAWSWFLQGCMGLWLLFRIVGTTWPAAVLPGLLAAGTRVEDDLSGFHREKNSKKLDFEGISPAKP